MQELIKTKKSGRKIKLEDIKNGQLVKITSFRFDEEAQYVGAVLMGTTTKGKPVVVYSVGGLLMGSPFSNDCYNFEPLDGEAVVLSNE